MNTDKLKDWLHTAAPIEIDFVAKEAETSEAYLRQIASGHRIASADMAGRIAGAVNQLFIGVLDRGDLSPTCASCSFYIRCSSGKKDKDQT